MTGRIYLVGALLLGLVVPVFGRARGAGAHPGARARRADHLRAVPAAHLRAYAHG